MRPYILLVPVAASLLLAPLSPLESRAQMPVMTPAQREALHRDPEWLVIAPHLPDPKTATGEQLETAADVLRARRFPEDAVDYYKYAIARGAPLADVMNKIGVVHMELQNIPLAHEVFQQITRTKKKDPTAWNNLGVTEYMQRKYKNAIIDYKRASKLNRTSATYHSNLGMAYFESGDMESARKEFTVALALDPHSFDKHETGGTVAQVVGTQNYAGLAYEMARMFARHKDDKSTILWLSKATEAGYDTRHAMAEDEALRVYLHDPRVVLMMKNAEGMKTRAVASAVPTESLGPAAQPAH